MYQPIVIYIGLRYVRRQISNCLSYFTFWVSSIGIMLGVMALIIILSVMNGFESELENNILKFIPQALLTNNTKQLNPKHITKSVLNKLTGITCIAPLITSDIILQSAYNFSTGVLLGINPEDPEPLVNYLIEAKKNDLVTSKYQVILGSKLANTLSVKRGDLVRLIVPGTRQITPIGDITNQRLFTVIGTFTTNSEVDNYQLLINQKDASRLMGYPYGYITGWRLWLQYPLLIDKWSIIQPLPNGLTCHDWRERKGELFQAIHMERNMMCLMLSLIIVIAIFNIITSLGMLIMEKQGEIAILHTQGLTSNQIMLLFIIQGGSASIIGALLGALLGILLSNQINYLILIFGILPDKTTLLPVVIKPIQVIFIVISSIVLSLLSTIYPSWHATTFYPSEILRYE